MIQQTGLSSLRLRHQQGVHLIILQHLQPDVHVIHLNTEHALRLQLGRVHSQVSQQVCHRVARHSQHLVVKMLQVGDTGTTVRDQLPVGIGGCQIA